MQKVLVSFDEQLLKRIDRAAREMRMSRSALLAELASNGLAGREGPGADPEVHRAFDELQRLFEDAPASGDSTQIIRSMRDSR
ncbi:MAG: ribbon-helix-helix protein, CopG family [Thermoleophilales bacterium]|nr:ribbon-helix-helix protein, CopG family [Thermoleophilales bacterium]